MQQGNTMIASLIREMSDAGLRPASRYESGWYWRSIDGHSYWVTAR